MEIRASSQLYASVRRLHGLSVLFDVGDPHCAQRNQVSIADLFRVPVIDGDRRPVGGIVLANFDLCGTTLLLDGDEFV
jgi:hypothetical protein